jgi:hypothetical protein
MTPELMATFYKQGYVVVPGACSVALREKARRAINRSLGQGPDAIPNTSPFKHIPKIVSSCPELMITPEITDLFRKSEAIKCVHSLVGAPVNRIFHGQIALRYPGDGCIPPNVFDNTGVMGKFILQQGLKVANRNQVSKRPRIGEFVACMLFHRRDTGGSEQRRVCQSRSKRQRVHSVAKLSDQLAHRVRC